MKVTGITRKVLRLILEASRGAHPREFASMLRARDGVIYELVLVPGTVSGNSHAILNTHHLPVDFSIVGTVHSHPSPYPVPSEADLTFFQSRGFVHIIVAHPYDRRSWRSYDRNGAPVILDVI